MLKRPFIFILVSTLGLPHWAIAEDVVTLHSLTDYVYQHAPQRLAEASLQQISDAQRSQANTIFADSATFRLNHFNDTIGSDNGFQEWESALEMPLWLPGQKRQQSNLSLHQAAQLPYYQQALRLHASAQVRQQVWQVMQAAAAFKQAELRHQQAKQLQQSMEQGIAEGLFTNTDILLSDSHVAAMHVQEVATKAYLQQQLNQYHFLTGQMQLPEQVEEPLSPIQTVGEDHPLLAQSGQQIATLRSEMENARYAQLQHPTVSIGIKRERWQFGEAFNNSLGLGFSVPLGNNTRNQPAIANANRSLADAEIERQQLKRHLALTLLAQRDTLRSQQHQQLLLKQQYAIRSAFLATQHESLQNGGIDLYNYINMQDETFSTREEIQLLEIRMQQQIAEINQTLGLTL